MKPLTETTRRAWRVLWTHPTENARTGGALWEDRESADWIADVMRAGGGRDVEVTCYRATEREIEESWNP